MGKWAMPAEPGREVVAVDGRSGTTYYRAEFGVGVVLWCGTDMRQFAWPWLLVEDGPVRDVTGLRRPTLPYLYHVPVPTTP